MLNFYEIFIICHCQCQNFWEPTLTNCKHFNFHFQKQIKGKKKSQKCIASNIHLNATLLVCHGYCSHVAVIGFWGWFVVVALLGRRWNGRRIVRRQFWCVVCTWETNELYVGQWEVLDFWDLYVFIAAGFCFCFLFFVFLFFLFFFFLICTKDGNFFLRIKKKKKKKKKERSGRMGIFFLNFFIVKPI